MICSGEPVARFVSQWLGFGLCPPYTAMGLLRGDEIVAGVLFNQFEGADVHVTAAGTGWTRGFLQACGRYVFETLDCERVTVTTEHEGVAMLAERLGGVREGLMRNHFGRGRHGIIVGILRDEYRYFRALECVGAFG